MMTQKLFVVPAAALSIAALTIAFGGQAQGQGKAPTQDVFVTNSAAQPIPTSIAGRPSVMVANDASAPALVRNVDQPVQELFQEQYGGVLDEFSANGCAILEDVPAGKRLMIQHVTVNGSGVHDQNLLVSLVTSNGTNADYVDHTLDARWLSESSGLFIASQPLTAYAAPGTQVCLALHRFSTGSMINVGMSVTGYLVPAP